MKQPVVDDPAKVTAWTLKNGVRVALLRDSRARIASVDLRFDVGASDDPYGHPGYALLAGEAIVAAGAKDPALDRELTTQLSVDLDRTELTSTALDLDAALTLAQKRLQTTCDDFTPELVESIRKHALEQLTGIPPSFVQAVWGEAHPYAHELANPELQKISPEELCTFYRAHYAPSAVTVVITGALATDVPGKIEAKLGALVAQKLVPQPAVPTLTTTRERTRHVVWGLLKPTAALAFPVPAEGDIDDIAVDLVVRKLDAWATQQKVDLHTAVVGGRRGRTLVLGVEAERESDLPRAYEKLHDVLNEANTAISVDDDDTADTSADDQLLEAQTYDDAFLRGGVIADLVASGRKLDLLRRVRQFAHAKSPHSWIRERLTSAPARIMDLIPAVANEGSSIESLGTPATASAWSLAGTFEPATAISTSTVDAVAATEPDPAAAAPRTFDRPIADYTLKNGLRVVLASDPFATTMDVRVVLPVGTRDEAAPGVARRAASELAADDGYGVYANEQVKWYSESATSHSDTDVVDHSTHFRDVGFATLGDWHLWSVAWHVITGHYDSHALDLFRRHYSPKGAVLIVSGGFNPKAAIPIIERWYGGWKAPTAVPPAAVVSTTRAQVFESGEAQTVDLDLAWGPDTGKPGVGELIAMIVQDRLALATRTSAAIRLAFDGRDGKLLLTAQIDPGDAVPTTRAILGELATLRANGVSASELARARRRTVANVLVGEVGVSGRAQRIEVNVLAHRAPNDDSLIDELRAATADEVTDHLRTLLDPKAIQVTVHTAKNGSNAVLQALGIDPKTAERR